MQPHATRQVNEFLKYLRYQRRMSAHTIAAYGADLAQLTAFCEAHCILDWRSLGPRFDSSRIRGEAGSKSWRLP